MKRYQYKRVPRKTVSSQTLPYTFARHLSSLLAVLTALEGSGGRQTRRIMGDSGPPNGAAGPDADGLHREEESEYVFFVALC
eukprot:2259486-Rhodomonas_salina.2